MIGKTLNHFKVLDRLLINETLARKYFAGEDAIGKQLIIHMKDDSG